MKTNVELIPAGVNKVELAQQMLTMQLAVAAHGCPPVTTRFELWAQGNTISLSRDPLVLPIAFQEGILGTSPQ